MQLKLEPVEKKRDFMGRLPELSFLSEIAQKEQASILVVYGRRRVGKTELIEQAYRSRQLIKFEGIYGKNQAEQIAHVLWQLSEYAENPLLAQLNFSRWVEVFKLINDYLPETPCTLYFEEVQWIANYEDDFISELKFAWDNYFRHKKGLVLILCGSAPSFMINHIIKSKSLYNRSQHELHLKEFTLQETKLFLKKRSDREVIDAYLCVGGIPEYLNWVHQESSVFLGLCKNSFTPDSFFEKEYERIFISSLAENKHYREIIKFLATKKFSSRAEILKHLGITSSGSLSELLTDLELCGFIEKYTSYNLKDTSKLARYCITDAYLQFFYKFIKPVTKDIDNGKFIEHPSSAFKMDTYNKWLGFSFERFCRRNHKTIANLLGFSGVRYRSGAFFNRNADKVESGYQIDLVFDRDDRVTTLCEIKYLQTKVDTPVIAEFEKKLSLFPNKENKTLHKILITTEGATDALLGRGYFDRIILLPELFRD